VFNNRIPGFTTGSNLIQESYVYAEHL